MSYRAIHRFAHPVVLSQRSQLSSRQCIRQIRHVTSTRSRRPLNTASTHNELDIRNPLDKANNRRKAEKSIREDMRMVKILALGAGLCMAFTFGIMQMVKLPDPREQGDSGKGGFLPVSKTDGPPGADKFQGKEVVVAAGGAKLLAHDDGTGEDIELVETGTSSVPHFPRTIRLPTGGSGLQEDSDYTLIGLGIRTVSFLGIQVYVVGLYVETASLAALQSRFIKRVNPLATALIPGEKETLRKDLLHPENSQEIWDALLRDPNSGVKSAIRIVPTRGTDFNHLRDGFVRGITQRSKEAQQKGDKQYSDESFGLAMKDLNALFGGKGKAPKNTVLILTRNPAGRLGVLYQEKVKEKDGKLEDFGSISDERISRLIWLGYLGGKNVSSEPARKGIADGIIELVERPVGTAALKIS